jgi:hypothetical protein
MIVLDTHIWLWWTHGDEHLPMEYSALLQQHEHEGLGVNVGLPKSAATQPTRLIKQESKIMILDS